MTGLGGLTSDLPDYLAAAQLLVSRCASCADRKALIVALGAGEAITREEAHLLITANQLETA